MTNEETPYEQGLHYGYGIARFEPYLYEDLKSFIEPTSEFVKGALAGGKEFEQECTSLRLQQLRGTTDTPEIIKEVDRER